MTVIGFLICIIVIGLLTIPSIKFINFRKSYPEYYKEVWIKYNYNNHKKIDRAWLTYMDDGSYAWTLSKDNVTIIDDDNVIEWWC